MSASEYDDPIMFASIFTLLIEFNLAFAAYALRDEALAVLMQKTYDVDLDVLPDEVVGIGENILHINVTGYDFLEGQFQLPHIKSIVPRLQLLQKDL